MKIHRTILDHIAAEQSQRQTRKPVAADFQAHLARELDKAAFRPDMPAEGQGAVGEVDKARTTQALDRALGDLERYARRLEGADPAMDLKEAYEVLQRISRTVDELRKGAAEPGGDPLLRSMVDELNVLTVTETFKFNRGDYMS